MQCWPFSFGLDPKGECRATIFQDLFLRETKKTKAPIMMSKSAAVGIQPALPSVLLMVSAAVGFSINECADIVDGNVIDRMMIEIKKVTYLTTFILIPPKARDVVISIIVKDR
ncbi:hypothetical protein DT065_17185 [Salicibibacter kimchii]|uniref:Uncharacterized protein n=1 Tax=Salicibibacter kimchii TaxID=2099786 RepID=A0A345C2W6_9BACI|nr:hypothetical protein DT065_17185 [Salicibibacter kimchii]